MVDLAVIDALELAWRPLRTAERPKADYYLGAASRRIRRRWPDVDSRISNPADRLTDDDVSDVVIQMVVGALDTPSVRGAKSFSEGVGPMSRSATLAAASTDPLVIEDWMVEVFEGGAIVRPAGSFPRSANYDSISVWPEGSY